MTPPASPGPRAHPRSPAWLLPVLLSAALFSSGTPRALAAAGDFDLSLNGSGTVFTTIGQFSQAYAVVLQPDGKFIAVGQSRTDSSAPHDIALVRYLSDGTIDTTFGDTSTGIVTTRLGLSIVLPVAAARQPDGRIIVTGHMAGTSGNSSIFASRYFPDGRLDTAFAGTGLLAPSPAAHCAARAIAVQSDGKFVIAGLAGPGGTTTHSLILRFMPDGTPDPGFNGGTVITPVGNFSDSFNAVALQNDGKIVVAGTASSTSVFGPSVRVDQLTVVRYLPDGRLDPDFGEAGIFLTPVTSPGEPFTRSLANCLAVQEDGSIIAGGAAQPSCALLRLDSSGRPDPAFNGIGRATYTIPGFSNSAVINSLTVDAAGRIAAAGNIVTPQGTSTSILLGVLPDGRLDPLFHGSGTFTNNFGVSTAAFSVAALESGGTLLIAGSRGGSFREFLLARYQLWSGFTVEQPARTVLIPNSPQPLDYGLVTVGTRFREFTVRNTGQHPLTNLTVSLPQQSHPGEFTASPPSLTIVPPGGTTTFTILFTPSAAPGPRTATLQVRGLDPEEQLFTTTLTGTRASPLQVWRYTWFGSFEDTGPGADLNDFDRDGLTNLVEYALGTHPHQSTSLPITTSLNGPVLELTYTRPVATLTEVIHQPQSAPTPAGPWSPNNITATILTDNGITQTVKALIPATTTPLFVRVHITRP